MSLSHQKFREIVFQILYSKDVGHPEPALIIELMMNELAVSKKNVKQAQEKVEKIFQFLPQIDPMIGAVSATYDFDRIQIVTKNILRLGVYELFFEDGENAAPPKVVIAEAIRLSRKFSSPESASFVNALLDHLYQVSLGNPVDTKEVEKPLENFIESEKESLDRIQQTEIEAADEDETLT